MQPVRAETPKTSFTSIIILVLVSLCFAIFVIEVATRLMPELLPFNIRIYFIDENYQQWGLTGDPELGFKYAPNLTDFLVPFDDDTGQKSSYPVSTVSLGYVDSGFRDDGLDGEAYAVVVGDSFASCAGVAMESCWVESLEQLTGRDFANLGVISYGAQQNQRMLTKYGLPLKPKLVVWVFFANDPYDTWRFAQFGKAEAKEGRFWENPILRGLMKYSSTFKVLAFFWYNRYFYYNLINRTNETALDESNWIWWQTITSPTDPNAIEGLHLTQQLVLDARQQTLAEFPQAEFVVVIIPTREQVYLTDTALQTQLDALNQNVIDFAQAHNISVIDLSPAMKDAAKKNRSLLYFQHDMHLNPIGNRIVAELLHQRLAEIMTQ